LQKICFFDGVFVLARDIPYRVVLQPKDEATQIAHALKANAGGCTAKHSLLGRIFRSLGLKAVYLDYPFYWQDQEYLPQYLRDIAYGLPISHHLSLEIITENSKQFIDATWDKGLATVFPVNAPPFSTGKQCVNAVTPSDEPSRFESLRHRESANGQHPYSTSADEKLTFYAAFNSYLAQIQSSAIQP